EYDPLSRIVRTQSGYFDPEGQMRALGVSFDTRPPVSKKFNYDVNGQLLQSEDVFNGAQRYAYCGSVGRFCSTCRSMCR
ncbi:MAG: hypothetical protein LBH14_05835, partial [Desulfobulbaceae bacterium]|nr:hypothetical protein [Desulfobulbaceae bacterium]